MRINLIPSRLLFLGVFPILLVSILNLSIYLVIVKAGKLEVTNSLHGQVEMMRRNTSNRASSSGSMTSKTQFCEMKTEILTEGNSSAMTRIATYNCHKHSDASDVDEVCPDDQLWFVKAFCQTCKTTVRTSLKKKNERSQFFILFSIVIIFLICNIPRIILLLHQVIIIENIK